MYLRAGGGKKKQSIFSRKAFRADQPLFTANTRERNHENVNRVAAAARAKKFSVRRAVGPAAMRRLSIRSFARFPVTCAIAARNKSVGVFCFAKRPAKRAPTRAEAGKEGERSELYCVPHTTRGERFSLRRALKHQKTRHGREIHVVILLTESRNIKFVKMSRAKKSRKKNQEAEVVPCANELRATDAKHSAACSITRK